MELFFWWYSSDWICSPAAALNCREFAWLRRGKVLKLLLLRKLPPWYLPSENSCLSWFLSKRGLEATLRSGKVAYMVRTVWGYWQALFAVGGGLCLAGWPGGEPSNLCIIISNYSFSLNSWKMNYSFFKIFIIWENNTMLYKPAWRKTRCSPIYFMAPVMLA